MHRMGLYRLELLVGQLARLVEDAIGDGELADVVQQRGASQDPALVGVEAEHDGDPVGDLGDALRVTGGERRLGVDDARERLGDAVQASVVGGDGEVRRLPLRDVGRLERGPELPVAAEARKASTSAGSNQRPRRRLAIARAALTPPWAWNTSSVWARHRMRAARGISSPRSPSGMPAPVPVLVEAADRRGGLLGEEQHARDLGAAVAPGLHEAARDIALVADALAAPRCAGAARRRAPPCAATTATPARPSVQSTSFALALAARSSVANSAAIRLAFAEQPASLSSSA